MARAALAGRRQLQYHFPQLDQFGRCAKSVKPSQSGSNEPCGQDRYGDRHLYYRCRKSEYCRVQTLSLEERDRHESEKHR